MQEAIIGKLLISVLVIWIDGSGFVGLGMNKGRRHELKMNKYKRRLKLYGLKEGINTNLHAFRSHGKPCSCSVCQQPENNYHRSKNKINQRELLQEWDNRFDETDEQKFEEIMYY